MNIRLTPFVCLLLILCSCKSLRSAVNRNNSSTPNTYTKKKSPQFLDDVSITPGEKKNNNYSYNKQSQANKNYNENITPSNLNIEKADWLQIKYAIMMDLPVEQLNNLPLLQQIDHWWGTRYCLGGNDENCIDCSGFTQTILRTVYGVNVPRTAHEQYDFSTRINDEDLKEGDLVFFKSGRSITHVGLYLANNKFVNASTSGGVTISDITDDYWSKRYAGAGRVISASQVSR